jgi:hypothetical protein
MTNAHRQDWLARLARRSAGAPLGSTSGPPSAAVSSEDRFSRATVVRLAVAGAASLSLGLWRAPPLYAEDRGHCFTGCIDRHQAARSKAFEACEDFYATSQLYKKPAWKVALLTTFNPIVFTANGATLLCVIGVGAIYRASEENCIRHCRETCRKTQSRTVQSRFRSMCEVTRPPKADSPPIPPPQDASVDGCLICHGGGGFCCAPCGNGQVNCATPCPSDPEGCPEGHIPCSQYVC